MRVPDDFAQRIQPISTASLDQDTSTTGALVPLYRSALDQNPDSGGWGYWFSQDADGRPLANIAQVSHDSAEFPATWTDFDGTVGTTQHHNPDGHRNSGRPQPADGA